MSLGLLFPGQGSQFVGMGRDLVEAHPLARETFDEADDLLGFDLSGLMFEGPEEELVLTKNAQPALLVHSVAVYRIVRDRLGVVVAAAGHSLGEFSAHTAAGTLSFAHGLRAVRRRGELMYEEGERRPGTMAAVLGLDDEALETICSSIPEDEGVCVPANFNSPGQVVISGDERGVARASELASEAGAKRVIPLSVSGAFHSPLVEGAEAGLAEELEALEFNDPEFPVVSNVTAEPVTSGDEARMHLVSQLTSPVRWSASVARMLEMGVGSFAELGAGSVLCGLNRRNAKGVPCAPVGDVEQVANYGSVSE